MAEQNEKTFTQDDVNRIVKERLAEDRARAGKDLSQREIDLDTRERKLKAREALAEKNLPSELVDALNLTDDEAMTTSLDLIAQHYKASHPIPSGGEPGPSGPGPSDLADYALKGAFGLD